MDIATYIKEGVKFPASQKSKTKDYFQGIGPEVTRSVGRKLWYKEQKFPRQEEREFQVHEVKAFIIKG